MDQRTPRQQDCPSEPGDNFHGALPLAAQMVIVVDCGAWLERERRTGGASSACGWRHMGRQPEVLHMAQHDRDRRLLLSALTLAPFAGILRPAPAAAQSGMALPAIEQPAEKTKPAFLARARALRDQAVKEGDQAYGAIVVRNGIIVGEGRNYVVLQSDPTAHAELLAVRDAARRLNKRDLSDCDVPRRRRRAQCAKVRSIGRASAAITTRARRRAVSPRNLDAR
jgi:hypothetical protein